MRSDRDFIIQRYIFVYIREDTPFHVPSRTVPVSVKVYRFAQSTEETYWHIPSWTAPLSIKVLKKTSRFPLKSDFGVLYKTIIQFHHGKDMPIASCQKIANQPERFEKRYDEIKHYFPNA